MADEYCFGCAVGLHSECNSAVSYDAGSAYHSCCCWRDESQAPPTTRESEEGFTPEVIAGPFERVLKDDSELRDQTSTGRKRAIKVIESMGRGADGTVCEWAGLAKAGGGAQPIVGCRGNIIRITKRGADLPPSNYPRNVHHGPDKSTTNNEPRNLHVICPPCHNRWHGLNDPYYSAERPDNGEAYLPTESVWYPHDSETEATESQLAYSDAYWSLKPALRKQVPYTVPKE